MRVWTTEMATFVVVLNLAASIEVRGSPHARPHHDCSTQKFRLHRASNGAVISCRVV